MRKWKTLALMHAVAGALLACAAVLYRFSPEKYGFYPQCPVFRYLRVYCPGCGATRAIAALLHGRIGDAVHFNALAVTLLPLLLLFFVKAYLNAWRNKRFAWPVIPEPLVNALLFAALLFAVARNALGAAL